MDPIIPSKMSWEFIKKEECDIIVRKWQMYFQASNFKGRYFLNLNNSDGQPICLTYFKDKAWLKHFHLFNLLYVHITRLITNHTLIGKYKLRFFPNKLFTCPCGNSSIEIRSHILHEYIQYVKLWNPKWKFFKDVLMFLKFNPEVFCFQEGIT